MSVGTSKMLTKCLILSIGFFVTGSKANVAPFIKPCPPLDSECITNSAKIALPHFAKGIAEFDIPAIDPLLIKYVKADVGDLKLTFKNIKIHKISTWEYASITRDPVKSTISIKTICPLFITGDYKLGGKLFFLDIEGEDEFEIKGGKMRIEVELKLKSYEDEQGKKHYKIGGFDYKYEPVERYEIDFKNLFNGDKVKAEPIQKVMNESWKELILDIGKPVIKEGILDLSKHIDKMLRAVPAEELEIA